MIKSKPDQPSFREFMRSRRPELYSDTLNVEESEMDRRQFEYHLHTLTSRKEETAFESFARALAEKELCPNLITQTGPTGGGDSKVDTETYPVAASIATLWYEGDPSRSTAERWAFAVSAKAKWKPKIDSDVAKIVATDRPYSLVYFISNQAIRDKDRAETEDALKAKYGIEVRIMDRSWIVEKVSSHKRWQLVADTLQFELQRTSKAVPGPLDTGRLRDLEVLDKKIEDTAGDRVTFELVEESLQSAILARSLDKPRMEVDGRFDRAERLARGISSSRQLHRIWYQRAWTAIWWFNDLTEALRLYVLLATETLLSEWIWDLEKLVNLWLALQVGQPLEAEQTAALRVALQRHADDRTKETSSLWARTQLLFMDQAIGLRVGQPLAPTFKALREIMAEVRKQIEFPIEPIVRLVRELAEVIGDSPAYDELLDSVIEIERERHGDSAAGELRLERGLQKLSRKKSYEAIDDLAKAQFLLAQEEHRGEFIVALAGTGLAYESAGLLFAARANLVFALDRCLYSYFKEGAVDARALPLLRKLVWLELQLGRVPYTLAWVKWMPPMQVALSLSDEETNNIAEEVEAIDRVLGILILKTPYEDWSQLTRLPDMLHSLGLEMSRAAALFMLGHEETVRSEYGMRDDDLQKFFSDWLTAPAAEDLPEEPSWHIGTTAMTTVVLGCRIDVTARGGVTSALLGESIIAFLEAFYSTAVQSITLVSPRAELLIEVRQSDGAKGPFSFRTVEDDCGETKLIVTHPITPAADLLGGGFEKAILEQFAHVTGELQLGADKQAFEEMFAKHRAQDRALLVARSIIAVTNVLGASPSGRAEDWVQDPALREYALLRVAPWQPTLLAVVEVKSVFDEKPTFAAGDPPEHLFGADAVRHRDMGVMSPINLPLWDRAGWKGVGVGGTKGKISPPLMILAFDNIDAGRKIFRGWRKKVGQADREGWIGVTVIAGIHREHPLDYRVAIGVGEQYMLRQTSGKMRFMTMVYRMHDMTPASSQNLDLLLGLYSRTGRIILQPMQFNALQPSILMDEEDLRLGIELACLTVVPAWQVDAKSSLIAAMRGIEDPFIPADVTDPPFVEVLRRLNEVKQRHLS
ncbi:MAG: hypothetical protein U1D41_12755 [Nitrosomonas sp.]|uniref:hypothetical protein n=1 Tax=Nitrosomonas sp. TaxID=42353 RepID=UPI002733106C|nr:hypothetical protein [Nitrosomonas sp.]MDP3663022.1 hypothetical protein [Nitrosomonas sp.]MDZ4106999.1 hypothetical protein [Nitrosomonas sp.]